MNYTNIHLIKLIYFSMMLVVSMLLSYVESLLPFQVAGIGIKIGLANIVTIVSIYLLSYIHSMMIGLLRVALLSYIFGNLIYFQLSISGFVSSFIIMTIMLHLFNIDTRHIDNDFSFKIILTSIIGSIFHNIAQVVVCYIILGRQVIIFKLLYILIPIAIVSGIIVGYLSLIILKLVRHSRYNR